MEGAVGGGPAVCLWRGGGGGGASPVCLSRLRSLTEHDQLHVPRDRLAARRDGVLRVRREAGAAVPPSVLLAYEIHAEPGNAKLILLL